METNIINILILSSRSEIGGGGEQYIQNVIKHIDRTRYSPIVAIPKEGSLRSALESLNINTICLDIDYGWIKPKKNWYLALSNLQNNVYKLTDIIKNNNIKLIHTNSNIRWEGALAARLQGIHHIYAIRVDFDPDHHVYSHFPLQPTSFSQLMSSLSTNIIAVSKECASSLSPPIPNDKIHIINNGIDISKFDSLIESKNIHNIRTELNISENTLLVCAVGRIAPDKGFDIYINAAILILKQHPNIHFLLIGSEENQRFSDSLKNKVFENRANRNIHFLGYRCDVDEILISCDIFVLSSRHEGQSNALLEAMACECSIISTLCSGVQDLIINKKNGLLIEIDNIEALTNALHFLISHPRHRKNFAKSARQIIRKHYNIQDKVNQLMDLYDKTLAKPCTKPGNSEITLLLQASREIGTLGNHCLELEERLKNIENFTEKMNYNFITKIARAFKKRFFNF